MKKYLKNSGLRIRRLISTRIDQMFYLGFSYKKFPITARSMEVVRVTAVSRKARVMSTNGNSYREISALKHTDN